MNNENEKFKIFYMGFPMIGWFEHGELVVDGIFSWIPFFFRINNSDGEFIFIRYEGSYWRCLYDFVRGYFNSEE